MSDAIARAFVLWMMVGGLAFALLLGFVFVQGWSRNLMTLGLCPVSVGVSLMPFAEVTGIHGIRQSAGWLSYAGALLFVFAAVGRFLAGINRARAPCRATQDQAPIAARLTENPWAIRSRWWREQPRWGRG